MISSDSLTNKDDEAMALLREALVQSHLLIRGGHAAAVGRAGSAGLASPPVGHPPPAAETRAETS